MNYTAKDIASRLADRIEDVCHLLLPGGSRSGADWVVGSLDGEKGKSLKIAVTGSKRGIWADFSTGTDAGDALDLWQKVKNVPMGEAIKQAKDWLGIKSFSHEPKVKEFAKPKITTAKKLSEASPVQKYLTEVRLLTVETIAAFRVAERNGCIVFPYLSPANEVLQVKSIGLERDEKGKKKVFVEANCAPCLFGWQAMDSKTRTCVITEGEIDAMTVHQFGMSALSVPFGAGGGNKNDWIDFEWDNLARFDTILLCYDNDAAGQGCVKEVADRLGIYRCKSVVLPKKDANECLTSGVDLSEVGQAFKDATPFTPPEVRDAAEFKQAVQDYFYPPENQPKGFRPYMLGEMITFGRGELTIWTGQSGHGKSLLLGQLMMIAMITNADKVAVASMEMKARQTLGRMLKQFWNVHLPTRGQINAGIDWMSGKIWIYDIMGNVQITKLLEWMKYSRCRHGVQHFVIDSLMKCHVGTEDYDAQRIALNDLTAFAKEHDCHVHLVAHSKKQSDEMDIPGKVSVKGSSDIVNQADNVIAVWRNKERAEGTRDETKPDCQVFCDKQRESGWEGKIPLFFSSLSMQFAPMYDKEIMWNNFWRLAKLLQPNDVQI